MKVTIQRLLPTVILPMVLVAGVGLFQHKDTHEGTAAASQVHGGDVDRDTALVPRDHRDLAVYSARVQGESQTRVFVQRRAHAPELVYVDPEPGELVEVNADGSRGVFRRFVSPEKSVYISINLLKRQS